MAASTYPAALDDSSVFPDSTGAEVLGSAGAGKGLSAFLDDFGLAIIAIEAKVGKTSSAVTTSHDYKLSGVTGSDVAVSKTGNETLTNKTLTSPVVTGSIALGSGVPVKFDADLNTKIQSDADDQLNYYVGGSEKFRMSSATFSIRTAGGTLNTDIISEWTTDGGVTIDSLLIKDGGPSGWDGWQTANGTWTYASANTITVPTGAAAKYRKGDRIKWTQTTVKYGVIIAVADTLLTIAVNTDYVVTNAAITLNYYSHDTTPIGYPGVFAYTPTFSGTLSNGTLTGFYSVVGSMCTVNCLFTMGSSTTFGGGGNTISLPITAATRAVIWSGIAKALDSGVADWLMIVSAGTGATAMSLTGNNTAGGWTSSSPFGWTTSDSLAPQLTYEI